MGKEEYHCIRMEKAKQLFEAKEEYFIRNGAMLLEKQITCNQGRDIQPIKIFSAKDIQQATNNFDPNLILSTEIATVYKGTLDEREVAIKVKGPPTHWPFEMIIDFFLNQVTIKQLIGHKNVMRLYGCCLETEIPMLVFQLISNGTLFDHPHGQCNEIPCWISWLDHERIATKISYALCYMDYGRPSPIVYLNVKSSNIIWMGPGLPNHQILVYRFQLHLEKTSFKVDGTIGYIYPEYLETLRVTGKCDVYGFGVELVEVLIGHHPIEMFLGHMNFIDCFVLSMEEDCILQIVDDVVLSQGNQLICKVCL